MQRVNCEISRKQGIMKFPSTVPLIVPGAECQFGRFWGGTKLVCRRLEAETTFTCPTNVPSGEI